MVAELEHPPVAAGDRAALHWLGPSVDGEMPWAWRKLRMNRVQPLLDHQEVPAGAERESLDRVRAGGDRTMRDPPASRHNDREPMADVDPGARRLRTRRCRSQAACHSEGADETCRKAHAISTVDSSRHVPGIASDGRIWRTEPARKILRSDNDLPAIHPEKLEHLADLHRPSPSSASRYLFDSACVGRPFPSHSAPSRCDYQHSGPACSALRRALEHVRLPKSRGELSLREQGRGVVRFRPELEA
jgi:hypothetical protein